MTRALSLEERLGAYITYVRGIADDHNWEDDALHALIQRTEIERRWSELSSGQQEQVQRTDELLLSQAGRVGEILPSPNEHDSRHWWWHLDEGPQAREKASAA